MCDWVGVDVCVCMRRMGCIDVGVKGQDKNSDIHICGNYMFIILMCVILFILQHISVIYISFSNVSGFNLARLLLHTLKM